VAKRIFGCVNAKIRSFVFASNGIFVNLIFVIKIKALHPAALLICFRFCDGILGLTVVTDVIFKQLQIINGYIL
jgi:hypothetical protein